MALLNPNFASPGAAPGSAENWTLSASTAHESIAGFDTAPENGWENFERWHVFVADFEKLPHVRAFFVGAMLGYESFNRGWFNDPFFTEFGDAQLETARLSTSGPDGFESNWSNASFIVDWSGVIAATAEFDSEPVEDFEEQWRSNQLFARDWSSVASTTATFDREANASESFEGAWSLATTQ